MSTLPAVSAALARCALEQPQGIRATKRHQRSLPAAHEFGQGSGLAQLGRDSHALSGDAVGERGTKSVSSSVAAASNQIPALSAFERQQAPLARGPGIISIAWVRHRCSLANYGCAPAFRARPNPSLKLTPHGSQSWPRAGLAHFPPRGQLCLPRGSA